MTTGQKVVDWILIVLGLTLMVVITTLSIVKLSPVCSDERPMIIHVGLASSASWCFRGLLVVKSKGANGL